MRRKYIENEIDDVANELLASSSSKILCLYGAMGAGKTTLVKAMIKALSGSDAGSSPTFGLVNEYHYDSGERLGYHFDFYRINDEMEALDIGFEDYLNQNGWIFIEWPEKILTLIPEDAVEVHIQILDEQTRELALKSMR